MKLLSVLKLRKRWLAFLEETYDTINNEIFSFMFAGL